MVAIVDYGLTRYIPNPDNLRVVKKLQYNLKHFCCVHKCFLYASLLAEKDSMANRKTIIVIGNELPGPRRYRHAWIEILYRNLWYHVDPMTPTIVNDGFAVGHMKNQKFQGEYIFTYPFSLRVMTHLNDDDVYCKYCNKYMIQKERML